MRIERTISRLMPLSHRLRAGMLVPAFAACRPMPPEDVLMRELGNGNG